MVKKKTFLENKALSSVLKVTTHRRVLTYHISSKETIDVALIRTRLGIHGNIRRGEGYTARYFECNDKLLFHNTIAKSLKTGFLCNNNRDAVPLNDCSSVDGGFMFHCLSFIH